MSRIGKLPIDLPPGVKINIKPRAVEVEGPKGKLTAPVPKGISIKQEGSQLVATRQDDSKMKRSLHGLTRSLIANAVEGVSRGFEKQLDVVGIGYKAEMRGRYLNMSLGFSHPIEFEAPQGIDLKVERLPRNLSNYVGTVIVSGSDKAQVGQIAADLRNLRPPDPYKGKGIRYAHELVRLKVGKKGA